MLRIEDIGMLKSRTRADNCGFTRIRGYFVDTEKAVTKVLDANFGTLEDNVFYKYLKIAEGIYGKRPGDNMLLLNFNGEYGEEVKEDLAETASSSLSSDRISDLVVWIREEYTGIENYLILFFADTYDLPRYGTDGKLLEDSEEVYRYMLCALCPVTLTKAGLEITEKSRIRARERDWVVGKPEAGFVYPAFEQGAVEEDKLIFYTADPKNPPHGFMENGLGTYSIETASEIRGKFERMFTEADTDEERAERYLAGVNRILYTVYMIAQDPEKVLTEQEFREAVEDADLQEEIRDVLIRQFRTKFFYPPKLAYVINTKAVRAAEEEERKKKMREMLQEAAKVIRRSSPASETLIGKLEDSIVNFK